MESFVSSFETDPLLLLKERIIKTDALLDKYASLTRKYDDLEKSYSQAVENEKKAKKDAIKFLEKYCKLAKKSNCLLNKIKTLEDDISIKSNELKESQDECAKLESVVQVYKTERKGHQCLKKDKDFLLTTLWRVLKGLDEEPKGYKSKKITETFFKKFERELNDLKLEDFRYNKVQNVSRLREKEVSEFLFSPESQVLGSAECDFIDSDIASESVKSSFEESDENCVLENTKNMDSNHRLLDTGHKSDMKTSEVNILENQDFSLPDLSLGACQDFEKNVDSVPQGKNVLKDCLKIHTSENNDFNLCQNREEEGSTSVTSINFSTEEGIISDTRIQSNVQDQSECCQNYPNLKDKLFPLESEDKRGKEELRKTPEKFRKTYCRRKFQSSGHGHKIMKEKISDNRHVTDMSRSANKASAISELIDMFECEDIDIFNVSSKTITLDTDVLDTEDIGSIPHYSEYCDNICDFLKSSDEIRYRREKNVYEEDSHLLFSTKDELVDKLREVNSDTENTVIPKSYKSVSVFDVGDNGSSTPSGLVRDNDFEGTCVEFSSNNGNMTDLTEVVNGVGQGMEKYDFIERDEISRKTENENRVNEGSQKIYNSSLKEIYINCNSDRLVDGTIKNNISNSEFTRQEDISDEEVYRILKQYKRVPLLSPLKEEVPKKRRRLSPPSSSSSNQSQEHDKCNVPQNIQVTDSLKNMESFEEVLHNQPNGEELVLNTKKGKEEKMVDKLIQTDDKVVLEEHEMEQQSNTVSKAVALPDTSMRKLCDIVWKKTLKKFKNLKKCGKVCNVHLSCLDCMKKLLEIINHSRIFVRNRTENSRFINRRMNQRTSSLQFCKQKESSWLVEDVEETDNMSKNEPLLNGPEVEDCNFTTQVPMDYLSEDKLNESTVKSEEMQSQKNVMPCNLAASSQQVEFGLPTRTLEFGPPARTLEFEPPARTLEFEPPARTLEFEPPARTLEFEPPARVLEFEPPARVLEFEPPARVLEFEPPARVLEFGPPARTLEFEPPARVLEFGPPARALEFGPPARTLEFYDSTCAHTVDWEREFGSDIALPRCHPNDTVNNFEKKNDSTEAHDIAENVENTLKSNLETIPEIDGISSDAFENKTDYLEKCEGGKQAESQSGEACSKTEKSTLVFRRSSQILNQNNLVMEENNRTNGNSLTDKESHNLMEVDISEGSLPSANGTSAYKHERYPNDSINDSVPIKEVPEVPKSSTLKDKFQEIFGELESLSESSSESVGDLTPIKVQKEVSGNLQINANSDISDTVAIRKKRRVCTVKRKADRTYNKKMKWELLSVCSENSEESPPRNEVPLNNDTFSSQDIGTGDSSNILDSIMTAMTKQSEFFKVKTQCKQTEVKGANYRNICYPAQPSQPKSCISSISVHRKISNEYRLKGDNSSLLNLPYYWRVDDQSGKQAVREKEDTSNYDVNCSEGVETKSSVQRALSTFLSLKIDSLAEGEKKIKSCIAVLRKASESVIATTIVDEIMVNVNEEIQPFERPAPPLTQSQHRIMIVLTVLSPSDEQFNRIGNEILKIIRSKIFPETFFWPDDSLDMASRFYAALCKRMNAFKGLWRFCFQVLTSMRQRWSVPILAVLRVWPDIIHNARYVKDNLLVNAFVHVILHSPKSMPMRRRRQEQKVLAVKHLLINFYEFDPNSTIEGFTQRLWESLIGNIPGSVYALVVVCKCRTWSWTRKNVITKMVETLESWVKGEASDVIVSEVLKVLQQITIVFPDADSAEASSAKDVMSVLFQVLGTERLNPILKEKTIKILCDLYDYSGVRDVLLQFLGKLPTSDPLYGEIQKALSSEKHEYKGCKKANTKRKWTQRRKTKPKKKKSNFSRETSVVDNVKA